MPVHSEEQDPWRHPALVLWFQWAAFLVCRSSSHSGAIVVVLRWPYGVRYSRDKALYEQPGHDPYEAEAASLMLGSVSTDDHDVVDLGFCFGCVPVGFSNTFVHQ
jgi:hypothetical protein